jgi:hypothetical protein
MHIIQNYKLKKNVVKKFLPHVMALLQGIKKLFNSRLPDSPIRGVDDSPTHRVGESISWSFPHSISQSRPILTGVNLNL